VERAVLLQRLPQLGRFLQAHVPASVERLGAPRADRNPSVRAFRAPKNARLFEVRVAAVGRQIRPCLRLLVRRGGTRKLLGLLHVFVGVAPFVLKNKKSAYYV